VKDISDTIEKDTPFPYIIIGEDDETEKGTKTHKGCLINSRIQIWTRSHSFGEAKKLISEIEEIIENNDFNIEKFDCYLLKTESDVFEDKDSTIKRGVIEIEAEFLKVR